MSTALTTLTHKLATRLDMGDGAGLIDTLTATMQVQRFPYRAIEALDIASEDV